MSNIANEITKLKQNIKNSYSIIESRGGTVPEKQNADNLSAAIDSIPSGGCLIFENYSELISHLESVDQSVFTTFSNYEHTSDGNVILRNTVLGEAGLPQVGATLGVQMILSEPETKAAALTADIVECPWMVLGYNRIVPQFLKFKSDAGDYIYVSSIDDSESEMYTVDDSEKLCYNLTSDHDFRDIITGLKTYSKTYNTTEYINEYSIKSGVTVTAVDSSSVIPFCEYWGTYMYSGNDNADYRTTYNVPCKITCSDGVTYKFVGYTIYIQMLHELVNNGPFDPVEISSNANGFKFEEGVEYYDLNAANEFTKLVQGSDYALGDLISNKAYDVYKKNFDGEMKLVQKLSGTNPNTNYAYGSNCWCESMARQMLNNTKGTSETRYSAQNIFEYTSESDYTYENTAISDYTQQCGGLLRTVRDEDFNKFIQPSIIKNWLYSTYQTGTSNTVRPIWYGGSSSTTRYTMTVDRMFLGGYDDYGVNPPYTTGDYVGARSKLYYTNTSGSISTSSGIFWERSAYCSHSSSVHYVNNFGYRNDCTYANYYSIRFAPACNLG